MNKYKKPELILSTDIEADGYIPGRNSMLSMGVAAFTIEKECIGKFYRNFETLPNAKTDISTDKFWERNPKAYAACRTTPVDPKIGMQDFSNWMYKWSGEYDLIFASWPVTYDFMWVYWYYCNFLDRQPPFSHSGWDGKTCAAELCKFKYHSFGKSALPKYWFDKGLPHTHIADDDALAAGCLFVNMLRQNRGLPQIENHIDLSEKNKDVLR